MLTLDHAEEIERLAARRGLAVEEFLTEALGRLGSPKETIGMRAVLGPQLRWLLDARPLELAPYYTYFYETADHPFLPVAACYGPQVVVPDDAFIAEYARPASWAA